MELIECCGLPRDTRYCPSCGRSLWNKEFTLWDDFAHFERRVKGYFDDSGQLALVTIFPPGEERGGPFWVSACFTVEGANVTVDVTATLDQENPGDIGASVSLFEEKVNFDELRAQLESKLGTH